MPGVPPTWPGKEVSPIRWRQMNPAPLHPTTGDLYFSMAHWGIETETPVQQTGNTLKSVQQRQNQVFPDSTAACPSQPGQPVQQPRGGQTQASEQAAAAAAKSHTTVPQ